MQIAPGIASNEWIALNLNSGASPDWETAVIIFERRI
jgi:hypothetical protein